MVSQNLVYFCFLYERAPRFFDCHFINFFANFKIFSRFQNKEKLFLHLGPFLYTKQKRKQIFRQNFCWTIFYIDLTLGILTICKKVPTIEKKKKVEINGIRTRYHGSTYFPFRLPARSTSATLSGNFLFKVSGSINEKRPALVAAMPKITTGIPAWAAPYGNTEYFFSKFLAKNKKTADQDVAKITWVINSQKVNTRCSISIL